MDLIEGTEEMPMAANLTVRLKEVVLQALGGLAEKTCRSRDWHVSQAIQDYVAVQSWQIERIEAGIAAADQGDIAADDEIARVRAKFSR